MPELPEIDALAAFFTAEAVGDFIAATEVAELSLLKTFEPPLEALHGLELTGVSRAGKRLVLEFDGLELVFGFARGGWIVWHQQAPSSRVKMGRGPLGMRVHLASGAAFDLREEGSKKNAAAYVVQDRAEVPAIAALGPDALTISLDQFAAVLAGSRARIKTVLQDQHLIAGIGNAYSDEILHFARVSPYAAANTVEPEPVHDALRRLLGAAREALIGLPPGRIKAAKQKGLQVHGRTGEPCPVCGTSIAEVSFSERSMQYCPGCQTGGKRLSDRRMDRLLK
ncbi:Fpg/Nei family DNA glycosylase [Brevibacterium daeguense]|uniref:Fpg/Nei family DNA glycosylase n=1 Tax=Brevibacterium daeguense TaxID=909936 RepID=A0ABP8EJW4_9MICO|nr:DNA-formamidopyrimidine glycosylase family protein [Brevibacterium daeguense]